MSLTILGVLGGGVFLFQPKWIHYFRSGGLRRHLKLAINAEASRGDCECALVLANGEANGQHLAYQSVAMYVS